MPDDKADALVFFGATGDLAYEQIFPALQALAGRGQLDMPGDRRGEARMDGRATGSAGT